MKLTGTWLRKVIANRSLSNNDLGSSDCRTMLCKVPRRTGSVTEPEQLLWSLVLAFA